MLVLYVQPNARQTKVAGTHGEAIKVRVAATPVDGAANDELVRFLARQLGLPRSAVTIVAGATARRKRVQITGITSAEALTRLLPRVPPGAPDPGS